MNDTLGFLVMLAVWVIAGWYFRAHPGGST
jgi:hypothetical protein